MKKIKLGSRGCSWLLASVLVTAASFNAVAQQRMDYSTTGWYVRGGIGPDFMPDTRISLDSSQPDAKTKFYTGLSLEAAAGYQFCPYVSLEAQTGLLYNEIRSIAGSSYTRAYFYQVPLMANLVFQLPVNPFFIPYAGIGAGLDADTLDFRHANVQGSYLHGSDEAYAFAAQAFAGVRVPLNRRMTVNLGYKFLASSAAEWDVTSDSTGGYTGRLALRDPHSHSILAEFTLNF